jgi:hypothetical protein
MTHPNQAHHLHTAYPNTPALHLKQPNHLLQWFAGLYKIDIQAIQ